MKLIHLGLIVMLMLAANTIAAGPLDIHMRAFPERTLPGLPFDLRLELTNTSDRQLNLANLGTLVVRDGRGVEFVAACGANRRCGFPQFNNSSFTLEPHEKVAVSLIDWPVPTSATWLDDPRLHRVGTYELQVVFNGPDGGTSNAARLVVEEPSGDDATVLKELRAPAGDAPLSADAFRNATRAVQLKLWQRYPESRYSPFLLAASLDPDKPAEAAEFLEAHPTYQLRDLIQLRIAQWHLDTAQAVLHIHERADVPRARREITLAHDQYQTLRRSAIPYVSETAKIVLAFIADRDDLNGLLSAPEKKPQP